MKDDAMWHVVGFSGGIDSQACARWVLNRQPKDRVMLLNSDAGGNEHPITTEFIRWYSENVHEVVRCDATGADIERDAATIKAGLALDQKITFSDMARVKGRFPSRMAQFCTSVLKLHPQKRWLAKNFPDGGYVRYTGVRREEGGRRRERAATQWDDVFECELRMPLVDWTKEMCFDYVRSHGEQVNALYTLGFGRVGCAPCINSSKDDILNWATRFPEMIDKIRKWEQEVGKTFFKPCLPGGRFGFVDEVVEWSKTVHGGRQLGLHVLEPPAACSSKYGLCE